MLFVKEIKKTVLSITFVVFLIALLGLPISQDVLSFSDKIIAAPQQGEDYGIQQKEVPELIMPAAFSSLYKEFTENEYIAYPIGFYKNVKLNDNDRKEMAEILSTLSGVSDDEISEMKGDIEVTLSEEISYEEFKVCMKRADDLIGGGSNYSENNLLNYSYVAITYEEAVENYNLIASKDKFTGAYVRLFCDYVGIILSILPVFIAVAVCLKDRRAKMNELIYARKTSSFKLILSRYFSIIIAVMLPTIVLAYISNSSVWGQYNGIALDYLAPLKYAMGWLMPSVMISASIGMFFTEFTGKPIAIAIQGLWWFIDLNAGVSRLRGVHNLFELTPRHNSLGNTQIFLEEFNTLTTNRLIIAGVALLFVAATVFVYEQKRRGNFGGYGKSKSTLQVWQITRVNLRHNFLPLFLLSAVIMILTPILFGTTGLDSKAAAVPLEMLISIIGIILLVPIFQPEQDEEIKDIVASKYIDSTYVHLIRIAYSTIGIILLVLAFSLFMFVCGCEITIALIGGTIADAMFLGAIGLLTSAITSNMPVSFMIPLLYYVLNLTMKSKLGNINLFSMMNGNYQPNIWLFISSVVFIVASILIKRVLGKK